MKFLGSMKPKFTRKYQKHPEGENGKDGSIQRARWTCCPTRPD